LSVVCRAAASAPHLGFRMERWYRGTTSVAAPSRRRNRIACQRDQPNRERV
jgi:hypothetical protein